MLKVALYATLGPIFGLVFVVGTIAGALMEAINPNR